LTGIANGRDGYVLRIINAAGQAAVLNNNDAGSAAANRILTGTSQNLSIAPDSSVDLVYDSATAIWRVLGSATGVTSIGSIDSQSKSANGAVIVGNSLVLQTADASFP